MRTLPVAFLFPGQGAQFVDMLEGLPPIPVVQQTLADACAFLRHPISLLDNKNAIKNTEQAQLANFIAGVASAQMLRENGLSANFLAGHSLGGFAAATFAGVISLEEGLHLVRTRARAMQAAYPAEHGMAAITGLSHGAVEEIVSQIRKDADAVYVAGLNSVDETTIAGSSTGLRRALHLARRQGARRAVGLNITVPSHTPLMHSVKEQMLAEFDKILPGNPIAPCISNRAPRILTDGVAILEDLAHSIEESVHWEEATAMLYEAGVRCFIEMQPGNLLTSLATKSFPDARCLSLQSAATADSLSALREISEKYS